MSPEHPLISIVFELTRSEIVKCMIALCQAVHYAHGRGLIHGDIKPSNVLVDDPAASRDCWISESPGCMTGAMPAAMV